MGVTSAAALPRQLSRFVIADYAGACGAPGYGKFTRVPLPHVAASTVVRRCRGTARRDVTALGVPRSATVLFSPRRQGNVNSIRRIDNDAVVRTCTDDGSGHLGRVVAACAPGEPMAL